MQDKNTSNNIVGTVGFTTFFFSSWLLYAYNDGVANIFTLLGAIVISIISMGVVKVFTDINVATSGSIISRKRSLDQLNNKLIATIQTNMNAKKSIELIKILKDNNEKEWTEEAFEAIRRILIERGIDLTDLEMSINQLSNSDAGDLQQTSLSLSNDQLDNFRHKSKRDLFILIFIFIGLPFLVVLFTEKGFFVIVSLVAIIIGIYIILKRKYA